MSVAFVRPPRSKVSRCASELPRRVSDNPNAYPQRVSQKTRNIMWVCMCVGLFVKEPYYAMCVGVWNIQKLGRRRVVWLIRSLSARFMLQIPNHMFTHSHLNPFHCAHLAQIWCVCVVDWCLRLRSNRVISSYVHTQIFVRRFYERIEFIIAYSCWKGARPASASNRSLVVDTYRAIEHFQGAMLLISILCLCLMRICVYMMCVCVLFAQIILSRGTI